MYALNDTYLAWEAYYSTFYGKFDGWGCLLYKPEMSTPDSLSNIFDSTLHQQRSKRERIESFLAEIADIPSRSVTYFYDARYLRQTAASDLIINHQDFETQNCILHAAKRLWANNEHRINAFELCRLPEKFLGDKIPSVFLNAIYLQLSYWLPEMIKQSGNPITALIPFFEYDCTRDRAKLRVAALMNAYGAKNMQGAACILEECFELMDLPGLQIGKIDNFEKTSKNNIKFSTPRTQLTLRW